MTADINLNVMYIRGDFDRVEVIQHYEVWCDTSTKK